MAPVVLFFVKFIKERGPGPPRAPGPSIYKISQRRGPLRAPKALREAPVIIRGSAPYYYKRSYNKGHGPLL